MEPKDSIPLGEAVSRGLVACSVCGRQGADVREIAGRKHFLCEPCLKRSSLWKTLLISLTVVVVGLLAALILRRPDPASLPPAEVPPGIRMARATRDDVNRLLDANRPEDALARAEGALAEHPDVAPLHLILCRVLRTLERHDASIPHFRRALELGGVADSECRFGLGLALAKADRASQALPFLERPFEQPEFEAPRRALLADCYVELERYEDGLAALGDIRGGLETLRTRHRALTALGRKEAAEKELAALEGRDAAARAVAVSIRSAVLREEGDLAGASREIETGLALVERGSPGWLRLRRSEATTAIEAGDAARLGRALDDLVAVQEAGYVGEALWYRALAALERGDREAARAAAAEFQKRVDPEYSPMRLWRIGLRHLLGELKDADVEAEAKATSRVRANDLYYYLALATGDKAWARKGLESTPGRNFPYHALQRLAGK